MPQIVDLHASKGLTGLIVGVCFTAIATGAVALRILSRRMMKTALGVDDYMIILALVWEPFVAMFQWHMRLTDLVPTNRSLAMDASPATL